MRALTRVSRFKGGRLALLIGLALLAGPPDARADNDKPRLIISEIMYHPPNDKKNRWEYVELYNPGPNAVDMRGFVLDDDDGDPLTGTNITSVKVEPGQFVVLFNAQANTVERMAAAWGRDVKWVKVTQWPTLDNQSERIGLWANIKDYRGRNFALAMDDVQYFDKSPWPADDGRASIYLKNLDADNAQPTSWALSRSGADGGRTADFVDTGEGQDDSGIGWFVPALVVVAALVVAGAFVFRSRLTGKTTSLLLVPVMVTLFTGCDSKSPESKQEDQAVGSPGSGPGQRGRP